MASEATLADMTMLATSLRADFWYGSSFGSTSDSVVASEATMADLTMLAMSKRVNFGMTFEVLLLKDPTLQACCFGMEV